MCTSMSIEEAQHTVDQLTQVQYPQFDTDEFIKQMTESLKVQELEMCEILDRRIEASAGWYNPPVIGQPYPKRQFKDVHRTRSRTHCQYKYTWRKKKPKKYRPK